MLPLQGRTLERPHYSTSDEVLNESDKEKSSAPADASPSEEDDWSDVLEHIRRCERGEITEWDNISVDKALAGLDGGEASTDNPVNSEASPSDNPVRDDPASEFTKLSVAAGPTDHPVNQKRSVSVFRDAKTMRQLRDLFKSGDFSGDDTSLVTCMRLLFTRPSKRFQRHCDAHPLWWDESEHPDLPSPARQYRKPAQWRDISDQLKVTLRHVALKTFGPVMAVTLNLSPEMEALARSQTYPLGWLHRRVSHHLNEALQRSVQFHVVMEEAGNDHRLHLHMEIQASFADRRRVREALRKIGGAWNADAPHRQFRTRLQPDIGWANYLVGDLWRVGFTRKVLPADFKPSGPEQTTIRFSGSPTCSTDLLDNKAQKIHGKLLALLE